MFAIEVPEGCLMEVKMIGYKTSSFKTSQQQQFVEVVLEAQVLAGIVIGIKPSRDDVYGRGRK